MGKHKRKVGASKRKSAWLQREKNLQKKEPLRNHLKLFSAGHTEPSTIQALQTIVGNRSVTRLLSNNSNRPSVQRSSPSGVVREVIVTITAKKKGDARVKSFPTVAGATTAVTKKLKITDEALAARIKEIIKLISDGKLTEAARELHVTEELLIKILKKVKKRKKKLENVLVRVLHRSLGISKPEVYPVDTYEMWLEGYDRNGLYRKFEFEIIRFGVHERADGSHHTVGLEAGKPYPELKWHPSYMGSGGWVLKKSYLIHAGPDSAKTPVAAIGCAEVMYGKWGFFKSKLRELSGFEEDDLSSDVKISGAGKFTAIVEAEKKPKLPEPIKR